MRNLFHATTVPLPVPQVFNQQVLSLQLLTSLARKWKKIPTKKTRKIKMKTKMKALMQLLNPNRIHRCSKAHLTKV